MRAYKPQISRKQGTKKDGSAKTLKTWWIEIKDHQGVLRHFAGCKDKQQTELLGRQIERLVNCKKAGELPEVELSRFVEGMSPKLRSKLAKFGLLDNRTVAAGQPLSKHIEHFYQSLLAKGDTEKQANQVKSRVVRIFDQCKFQTWHDIEASKVQQCLCRLRNNGDGMSIQTSNFYLQATKQFCKWMVQNQRANKSPVEHLSGLNAQTDRRHDRRALSVDEIHRLLGTTEKANTRFAMTGHQRALLYQLAIETGLRASELRSLTVSSFDFKNLTVTVEAAYSKHRRQDKLPLKPQTAAALEEFFADKIPNVQAFKVPDKPGKMLKADLDDAGIPYVDDAGRYADFHSLRHTTGTLLAMSGVHPKTIQSIMRHSDINLTMSRYTHIFKSQESEAIAKLPDLSRPSKQRKSTGTGTDG